MNETSGSGPEPEGGDEEAQKQIEKVKADNEKIPEKIKADNEKIPEKIKPELEKSMKREKEKNEKIEKNEIKENKGEKEYKNEKIEIKELKREKENKLEFKEFNKEGKNEFEKPPRAEGVTIPDPTTLPIERESLLQHAETLEQAAQQLRHFIEQSERPDLSRGALQNESDQEDGT